MNPRSDLKLAEQLIDAGQPVIDHVGVCWGLHR